MGVTRATAARDRLAVALDAPHLGRCEAILERLAGVPGWIKVGSELFTAAGPAALEAAGRRARVFLDAKFHDIPTTVARAVAAATRHGVEMLTVHAAGGASMLRGAREAALETASAAGREPPRVLGVTVLTSLGAADLKETGVAGEVEEQVARLVDLILAAGLDGVVVSALETAAVRRRAGEALYIVTPGIRSAASTPDDQVRTASVASALAAGSDLLVVGRPVLAAADPAATARQLVREIEQAVAAREA